MFGTNEVGLIYALPKQSLYPSILVVAKLLNPPGLCVEKEPSQKRGRIIPTRGLPVPNDIMINNSKPFEKSYQHDIALWIDYLVSN